MQIAHRTKQNERGEAGIGNVASPTFGCTPTLRLSRIKNWMMNPHLVLLCGFMLHMQLLAGQSPYGLSTGKDRPILGGEALLFGVKIALGKKFPPVTSEDVVGLNLENVPGIDQHVVHNWSPTAHRTSNVFLYSSIAVPTFLPWLAGQTSRHKMGVTYLIVFEGMLATYTLTELTKLLVKRKRPYVYRRSAFDGELCTRDAQKSFFSGHASQTAVHYYLGAKMFHDFYPDSKWKPAVWATAAIIPAITAWKRVQAGKHFVSDVLVGYAVGALVGILIPEIHRVL